MTHSIDAPLPPPTTIPDSGATAGKGTTSTKTTDVAKDEAKNVGQTAAEAGSQVAATAADQAKEVVHETQRQAQDLLQQGRSQVREQAITQQQKAAQGLTSLAKELRGLADGTSQGAPGPARDLLQQASGKVEELSSWLENREPADLLDEVRAYARRKPGMFLLGAALAGVVAGRLTSGVKAAHSDSSSGTRSSYRVPETGYPQANYVDPAPAYSGYSEPTYSETTYTETTYPESSYPETSTTGGYSGTAAGTPLPPPPYGTVPPTGGIVPPTTPAGWDDASRTGGVG